MESRKVSVAAALTIVAALVVSGSALGQLGGSVLPLSTTLVLEKPAPEQGWGKSQIIYIGVKDKTYRFILRDAYVDDPRNKFFWNDVWRSVEQFRPNFQVQGTDSDTFEKIKPGDVVTVAGMYAMSTRTFEVTNVTPGTGNFGAKHGY